MRVSFDNWRDCLFKNKIVNFYSENKINVHQHIIASISNFSEDKKIQLRRTVEISEIIQKEFVEGEWKYLGKFCLIEHGKKIYPYKNLKLLLSTLNIYKLYIAYVENDKENKTDVLPKFSFVKIAFNYNYKYLSYTKVKSEEFNALDDIILVKNIYFWKENENYIFPSNNFGGFLDFFENNESKNKNELTLFINAIKLDCGCSIINSPIKENLKINNTVNSSIKENLKINKNELFTLPLEENKKS
jgi:hypothetical protein